jgi:cyanophycinase-like exopeptidase
MLRETTTERRPAMKRLLPLLLALLAALPLASFAAKTPPTPQVYYRIGNAADVVRSTEPGTVLMGGGTDVDAAFKWLCERGGNGDFLVIRATGTDGYNRYVQRLCPSINSVGTLVISTKAIAQTAEVARIIGQAEAIFIAGGDQSIYITQWTGTPVQTLLDEHIRARPIGGTSAGLAVLTEFVYSALGIAGVTSAEALANPFHEYITLDRDFVSINDLQGTIGETHFSARDRMGRTLAFLCRMHADHGQVAPRAIALNEATALLISNGQAEVVGSSKSSNAYFIAAPRGPEYCFENAPLTYTDVAVRKVRPGGTFNLYDWSAMPVSYFVSAVEGVLTSTGASFY